MQEYLSITSYEAQTILETLQEAQDERIVFDLDRGLRGRIHEVRTAVNVDYHITEILFEIVNTDHPHYQSVKQQLGDDWYDGWTDVERITEAYGQAVEGLDPEWAGSADDQRQDEPDVGLDYWGENK